MPQRPHTHVKNELLQIWKKLLFNKLVRKTKRETTELSSVTALRLKNVNK